MDPENPLEPGTGDSGTPRDGAGASNGQEPWQKAIAESELRLKAKIEGSNRKLVEDVVAIRKKLEGTGGAATNGSPSGETKPESLTRAEMDRAIAEAEAKGEVRVLLSKLSEAQVEQLAPRLEGLVPSAQARMLESFLLGVSSSPQKPNAGERPAPPRSGAGLGHPPAAGSGVRIPNTWNEYLAMKPQERAQLRQQVPDFSAAALRGKRLS